jgi:hypothetical protein
MILLAFNPKSSFTLVSRNSGSSFFTFFTVLSTINSISLLDSLVLESLFTPQLDILNKSSISKSFNLIMFYKNSMIITNFTYVNIVLFRAPVMAACS